jgi:phosphoserine phosphatase
MSKIFLVRHCETEGNLAKKVQGYYGDTPLSKNGKIQAGKLGNYFKNEKIDVIYSSDLGRAMKTAEAIAKKHGLKVIPVKDLREANYGEGNGMSIKEIEKKWKEHFEKEKSRGIPKEEIRMPGGENIWDHQKRLMKAFNKIISENSGKNVLIVGHAGTNKILICTIKDLGLREFRNIEQDNACVNLIEKKDGGFEVLMENYTEFLRKI